MRRTLMLRVVLFGLLSVLSAVPRNPGAVEVVTAPDVSTAPERPLNSTSCRRTAILWGSSKTTAAVAR